MSQRVENNPDLLMVSVGDLAPLAVFQGGLGGDPGSGGSGSGQGGTGGGGPTGGGSGGSGSSGGSGAPAPGGGTSSQSGRGNANGGLESELNTQNGNRLAWRSIVGWHARGDTCVDLTLFHNSQGSYSGAFGEQWSCSYDEEIGYTQGSSAIVRWGDGTLDPYSETNGTFIPPKGVHDSLVHDADGTWLLTTSSQIRHLFDSAGRVTAIKDRYGNTVSIQRNGAGRIVSVADEANRSLTFGYDNSGRVSTVTDPIGRVWSFDRNASNDLVQISYPSLSGTILSCQFAYDANHCMTSETDLRGKVWTCGYDSNRRLIWFKDPLNHQTSVSYTTSSTTITQPGGQTTTDNYSNGGLASRVDPAGFSTAYAYDADFNAVTVTDKRGKVWSSTYDSHGNRLTSTDPIGHTRTFTFNSSNDLLTLTDALGNTTSYSRNAFGKIVAITDPAGVVQVQRTYDQYGQLIGSTNAISVSIAFSRDSNGNITSMTLPGGRILQLDYDSLGNLLHSTDSHNRTTSVSYDGWLRPIGVSYPDGSTQSWVLDPEDNILSTIDGLGHTSTVTVDDAGQITQVIDPMGHAIAFGYDSTGNLTTATNARGAVRTYAWTTRGELASKTQPDGAVDSFSYDANGNISGFTNPLAQSVTYQRDDAGRLTTADFPTGIDTTVAYDAVNRPTSMTDSTGTTTWAYNVRSTFTAVSSPTGSITYDYDDFGRRTGYTQAGVGHTSYSYDSLGRIDSIVNAFGETTSFVFDDEDRVARKVLSSGAYTDYTYDSRLRLASIVHHRSNGSVLGSNEYEYDLDGKLTTKVADSVATTYGYDADDKLTSETRTGFAATYAYDEAHNRTAKVLNGIQDDYTYDLSDKLLTAGERSYGYDGAGRITSITTPAGVTGFAYDFNDKLIQESFPNGGSTSFTYNGLGALTAKNEGASSYSYLYNGSTPGAALLSDGQEVYTPGVSLRRNGSTEFLHGYLSDVEFHTNSAQEIVWAQTFDAFGATVSGSQAPAGQHGAGGLYGDTTDPATGWILPVSGAPVDPNVGRVCSSYPTKVGCQPTDAGYGRPVADRGWDGDYWSGVGLVFKGEGEAVLGVVTAPVAIVKGLIDSRGNPIPVIKGILEGIWGDITAAYDGDCEAGGRIAGTVCLAILADGLGDVDCVRGCFVAGTQVLMADGSTKPIEKVRAGDQVATRAENIAPGQAPERRTVTRTFLHVEPGSLNLTFSDGGTVRSSTEHPFYVIGQGFTPASCLRIGDRISRKQGGSTVLRSATWSVRPRVVYNFEVDRDHTYFVRSGPDWLWVHNACEPPQLKYGKLRHIEEEAPYRNLPGVKVETRLSNGLRPDIFEAGEGAVGDWMKRTTSKRQLRRKLWQLVGYMDTLERDYRTIPFPNVTIIPYD